MHNFFVYFFFFFFLSVIIKRCAWYSPSQKYKQTLRFCSFWLINAKTFHICVSTWSLGKNFTHPRYIWRSFGAWRVFILAFLLCHKLIISMAITARYSMPNSAVKEDLATLHHIAGYNSTSAKIFVLWTVLSWCMALLGLFQKLAHCDLCKKTKLSVIETTVWCNRGEDPHISQVSTPCIVKVQD